MGILLLRFQDMVPTRVVLRPSSKTGNHLLSALAAFDADLVTRAESVALRGGQTLAETGKSTPYAYFPETAVVSLLTVMRNGSVVEAATVGKEGWLSIALALSGTPYNARRTVVQVPGHARRTVRALHAALARHQDVDQLFLGIRKRFCSK